MNNLAPVLAASILTAIILTAVHMEKADHKEAAPAEQPQQEPIQTDVEIGRITCTDWRGEAGCFEFTIYRSVKE